MPSPATQDSRSRASRPRCRVSERGNASMISLITSLRSPSLRSTMPEDRDEHDRERNEREKDAVGDAGGMLAAAVGEEPVDRLRDHPGQRAQELERPADEAQRPRRRFVGSVGVLHRASLGTLPGQHPPCGVHFRPLPSPVAQLAEHSAVNRRVVGSSPTRGASKATRHAETKRAPLARRPLSTGLSTGSG